MDWCQTTAQPCAYLWRCVTLPKWNSKAATLANMIALSQQCILWQLLVQPSTTNSPAWRHFHLNWCDCVINNNIHLPVEVTPFYQPPWFGDIVCHAHYWCVMWSSAYLATRSQSMKFVTGWVMINNEIEMSSCRRTLRHWLHGCSQWRKVRQHDDICVSAITTDMRLWQIICNLKLYAW